MAIPKLDSSAFEWLGNQMEPPAPPKKDLADMGTWAPSLNPTQEKIFHSTKRYILAYGEKGSGKTIGHLHKIVRHAFENQNALCIIIVKVKSMATKGGAWDKITGQILPEWKAGIGLEYSDVKFDPNHNEFLWVQNRFGGWSMITVMSCPHAHQLRERMRGLEPSIAFVDELTSCETNEYIRAIAAQIGRRPGIDGPQQYLAACNPEGPSNWVYKVWWEEAFDEERGLWDLDYEKWHVPIQENEHNLPEGYIENLTKLYKSDPIEADRMLRGLWIDRASGDSLFRDVFNVGIHVRPLKEDGNPDHKRRLCPIAGYPIIVGMDPGSVYNAYSYMQWLPPIPGITPWTEDMGWLIFDEVCLFKRKVAYQQLVPVLMRRIKFWRDQVPGKLPQVWLSDNSAFNQFRAAQGSYDVLEIDRAYEAHRERYGLEPLKTKPAPKFAGSRQIRVRLLSSLLADQRILVSSGCIHTRSMLLNLESESQKPGDYDPDKALSPKRSDWIHIFDALTYPIITSTLEPSKLTSVMESKTQKIITFGG